MLHLLIGVACALFFVTVWHEAGHLLVAKLLHIPIKHVSFGLGPILWTQKVGGGLQVAVRALPAGMSIAVPARREPDGQERRPIGHDILLAAGPPATSFLLAAALYLGALTVAAHPALAYGCLATAGLSAILALINLAPVPGLDGGHLVVSIVALLGWQFSPSGERKLHRYGLQAVTGVAIVPLILHVIGRIPA